VRNDRLVAVPDTYRRAFAH
jgi:inorganic pyrophosphatase